MQKPQQYSGSQISRWGTIKTTITTQSGVEGEGAVGGGGEGGSKMRVKVGWLGKRLRE